MCALENLELFPAEPEHLRHERHPIQPTVPVERFQDVFLAADLDPVAYSELPLSHFFIDGLAIGGNEPSPGREHEARQQALSCARTPDDENKGYRCDVPQTSAKKGLESRGRWYSSVHPSA